MSTTLQCAPSTEYGSQVDRRKRRAGLALPMTTTELGPTGGCRLIERTSGQIPLRFGAPVRLDLTTEESQ